MARATQSKDFDSVKKLLRDTMGMSNFAAATVAGNWKVHNSQTADMSTFVHSAIHFQIDQYCKQSCSKFNLKIAVSPADNAGKLTVNWAPFKDDILGHKRYVFGPCHNGEPSKTMRVRLSGGTVQVHFCGLWQPISAYLDEVGTEVTSPPDSRQDQLDRQSLWWQTNGKPFEILNLPGELRNKIYDVAFPSVVHPFPTHKDRRLGRIAPTFQHSCTAIMKVRNRQLHQESSAIFYQNTTFLVEYPGLLKDTLKNQRIQDRLRYLRLDLTHTDYLSLFRFSPQDLDSGPHVVHELRELANLESLEIHFKAPSRITDATWLEGACQKSAVDVIMKAAWASIKGLPVTFTGYIKDSQKKTIEACVRSEREPYVMFETWCRDIGKRSSPLAYDAWVGRMKTEEHGGVCLDGETSGEALVDETEDALAKWKGVSLQELKAAVRCTCGTKCTKDTWSAAD